MLLLFFEKPGGSHPALAARASEHRHEIREMRELDRVEFDRIASGSKSPFQNLFKGYRAFAA
jgi:hypothetical protein